MFTNVISKLLLIVLISILLNVSTDADDYVFPDYIPGYIDRRLVGPLKYFGETSENNNPGKGKKKRIKKVRGNEEIYADLIDPDLSINEVTARLPTKAHRMINSRSGGYCRTSSCFTCLESCKWLKKSRYSALDITQYTYLRICSEGCKENLACLMNNYCLPVMEENPDYFVLCANKCNLFEVIPQVFRTGQCD